MKTGALRGVAAIAAARRACWRDSGRGQPGARGRRRLRLGARACAGGGARPAERRALRPASASPRSRSRSTISTTPPTGRRWGWPSSGWRRSPACGRLRARRAARRHRRRQRQAERAAGAGARAERERGGGGPAADRPARRRARLVPHRERPARALPRRRARLGAGRAGAGQGARRVGPGRRCRRPAASRRGRSGPIRGGTARASCRSASRRSGRSS